MNPIKPELAPAHERAQSKTFRKRLLLAAGVLVSAGLLAFLVRNHMAALLRVGARIDWLFVAASVACAAGSYGMVAFALGEVLALLGHRLHFVSIFGIALVSTTANNFVSSAGISGFALKAHLLRKRHVPYGATVTASVVTSVILYFVLALILGQGLVYLALHRGSTNISAVEGVCGIAVMLAMAGTLIALFFHNELRGRLARKVFHWVNRAAFLFSKREIPREEFEVFESQLALGLDKIRQGRGGLAKTIAYTCLDWGFAMLALYFAFRAVGVSLSAGHLSAGFTVGQAAVLIPLLPAGIGAVEGSMAAMFESLGVAWDQALVAVLLYRAAYYLLPGLVSLFVLWGLKISEPPQADEPGHGGL